MKQTKLDDGVKHLAIDEADQIGLKALMQNM